MTKRVRCGDRVMGNKAFDELSSEILKTAGSNYRRGFQDARARAAELARTKCRKHLTHRFRSWLHACRAGDELEKAILDLPPDDTGVSAEKMDNT